MIIRDVDDRLDGVAASVSGRPHIVVLDTEGLEHLGVILDEVETIVVRKAKVVGLRRVTAPVHLVLSHNRRRELVVLDATGLQLNIDRVAVVRVIEKVKVGRLL